MTLYILTLYLCAMTQDGPHCAAVTAPVALTAETCLREGRERSRVAEYDFRMARAYGGPMIVTYSCQRVRVWRVNA